MKKYKNWPPQISIEVCGTNILTSYFQHFLFFISGLNKLECCPLQAFPIYCNVTLRLIGPKCKFWRKLSFVNTVHRHLNEQNDYWCKTPVLLWILILLMATTKNLAGTYAHLASLLCPPVCLVSLPALSPFLPCLCQLLTLMFCLGGFFALISLEHATSLWHLWYGPYYKTDLGTHTYSVYERAPCTTTLV